MLDKLVIEDLCCPTCKSALRREGDDLVCGNVACAARFPSVRGIPILINAANSVFTIDDFVHQKQTTFKPMSRVTEWLIKNLPDLSHNPVTVPNYHELAALLDKRGSHPKVLVVGGGILGQGMAALLAHPNIELVETDVYLGDRTMMVCDGHDLPFMPNTFDGVIVQAVLEHVVDPHRCVAEIYRVLKPAGLVYAETPFMQQVHMGRYDFTRFTQLGHRRLFRWFAEVKSGAAGGPGMALGWSYRYFLLSFFKSDVLRGLAGIFARLTGFWMKYFDYVLMQKPGGIDAASGFYFMGTKSETALDDHALLASYCGAI